jgi:hypothetical protein
MKCNEAYGAACAARSSTPTSGGVSGLLNREMLVHNVPSREAPARMPDLVKDTPRTDGETPVGRETEIVRMTFCIRRRQLERLRELSETTGTPISWTIRRALDDYLAGDEAAPVDERDLRGARRSQA